MERVLALFVLFFLSRIGRFVVVTRSRSASDFSYTGIVKRETLRLSNDKVLKVIHFESKQIRVITCYDQWYMRDKIGYLYEVDITVYGGSIVEKRLSWTVPHMGPRCLHGTSYPHAFAINACIDRYKKEHGV